MCKNTSILIWFLMMTAGFSNAQESIKNNAVPWSQQRIALLGCIVDAPGVMNEKELTVPTDLGDILQQIRIWKDDDSNSDNYLYSITSYDYPEGTFHQDSTELINALFEETILSSTEAFDGEILYRDDRSEWGHPARIWKMKFNNDRAFVKSKIILVGNRCYCLQVFMLEEYQTNRNADRFLNSFRLI